MIEIGDLPLYNQDQDSDPSRGARLKSEIAACAGLMFVTPEYNRSIPGRVEKRARPCVTALWKERVGRQARRRAGSLQRRHRHRRPRSSICA